jgi:hypothetical protein
MNSQHFSITITPDVVEKWKKEAADLSKKIKALTQKHDLLMQRINAVRWFLNEEQEDNSLFQAEHPLTVAAKTSVNSVADLSVPDVIRHFLREGPLSKVELKRRIKNAGYPVERFGVQGGYFYTALGRMERTGKIVTEGEKVRLK